MSSTRRREGRVGHRRILDIAAGIGTQALPLVAQGYEVTARDLSEKAIVDYAGSLRRLLEVLAAANIDRNRKSIRQMGDP